MRFWLPTLSDLVTFLDLTFLIFYDPLIHYFTTLLYFYGIVNGIDSFSVLVDGDDVPSSLHAVLSSD